MVNQGKKKEEASAPSSCCLILKIYPNKKTNLIPHLLLFPRFFKPHTVSQTVKFLF